MFHFLGEVNSHRKKRNTRCTEKQNKNDGNPRDKSNRSCNVQKKRTSDCKPSLESRRPPQFKSLDQFFDSMSIEASLYTTPSKHTVQYPCLGDRTSGNIEWHSSEGSEEQGLGTEFTAERALVNYRLGGWQSPPIIESSKTPSIGSSTFSSSSLSKSHRDTEVFRSSCTGVTTCSEDKVPLVSTYLRTVDIDPLMFVNAKESNLEVNSTNSSEISLNFDSRAFHEKVVSAKTKTHYDKLTTVSGKPITIDDEEVKEKDLQSNRGNDEDSVCSNISSLSTDYICPDCYKSNISTWSPASSPPSFTHDHTTLKSDRMSSNHRSYESPVTDSGISQGTKLSRKNDYIYSNNDSIPTNLNYDDQVSFSELISRCEGESLAERLAPYAASPSTRLFGRTIDTNSSDIFLGLSSLDLSKPQTKSIETSCLSIKADCYSVSKEKNHNIVTPKISNTSMSISNYNHMIPDASTTNHNAEVEAQTMEDDSISNVSSNDKIDFPSILSKFEAHSLEYKMEPLAPRRLTGQTFEIITDVDKREETFHFSGDELHQSEHEQNTNDIAIFEQDNRSFHNETTIRSSSPCNEEISTRIASTPLDCCKESNEASLERRLEETISEVGDKSFELSYVADTVTEYQNEHSKVVFVDELRYLSECRDIRDNNSIPACSNNDESPITISILQLEMNLRQIKSRNKMNLEKAANLDMTTEFDIAMRDKSPYYGPVDLDKLSMNGLSSLSETLSPHVKKSAFPSPTKVHMSPDFEHHPSHTSSSVSLILEDDNDPTQSFLHHNEEEDKSKAQSQSNCDGNWGFVEKTAIYQSYEEAMKSISTSKRVQVPHKLDSPGYLLLCEDELTRHEKLMEQRNPLPNPTIPGYDDWKREQEVERLYFEELHEKVMEQKNERGGLESPSIEPYRLVPPSYATITATSLGNTNPTMDESIDHTILNFPHRRRKTKAWKFFLRILQKNNDDPTGAKKGKGKKKKKQNKKEKEKNITKREKSVVTNIDNFMLISNNNNPFNSDDLADLADLSLFPLSQLKHLTNITGHDDLRKQIWEHLELEHQKLRLAEIDKDKDEWCEQIRTSILKEQELERQRRLNSPDLAYRFPHRVASPGLGFSNEQRSFNHQQTRAIHGLKLDDIVDPHKSSQKGYIYSSTPIKYLCDKSRVIISTARESSSLEIYPIKSYLHTTLLFDYAQTTSSLNNPKAGSTIPPCVTCNVAERTHISMPCMHYSFCSECAEELHGLETPICPICQTEDIILSRVYT